MKVSKSKNNGNHTPPLKGCQITMKKGLQNNRKYTGITFYNISSNNYIYNPIIVRVFTKVINGTWNVFISSFQTMPSFSLLKAHLNNLFRPKCKSIFEIHDRIGIRFLFQLRVGLSPTKTQTKTQLRRYSE